jgi:hypothetical protein
MLTVATAYADRYGLDEIRDEHGGSWGVVLVTILLLAYLHFKGK